MFLNQDYENKELIIFNTASKHLVLDDSLLNKNITVINQSIDSESKLPYTNIGDIRKDALSYATGDYYICWDDDDLYMPYHMSFSMNKLVESGKLAWKPKHSFFSKNGGQSFELAENAMEASIIVDISYIRMYGFKKETGSEHLGWLSKIQQDEQMLIEQTSPFESYCFNWGDEVAPHKQSGDINNPNNFENHKNSSTDFGNTNLKYVDVAHYYKNMYFFSRNQEVYNLIAKYL
jgi:glycosyltransferase involved in cell wall biosynthesis